MFAWKFENCPPQQQEEHHFLLLIRRLPVTGPRWNGIPTIRATLAVLRVCAGAGDGPWRLWKRGNSRAKWSSCRQRAEARRASPNMRSFAKSVGGGPLGPPPALATHAHPLRTLPRSLPHRAWNGRTHKRGVFVSPPSTPLPSQKKSYKYHGTFPRPPRDLGRQRSDLETVRRRWLSSSSFPWRLSCWHWRFLAWRKMLIEVRVYS